MGLGLWPEVQWLTGIRGLGFGVSARRNSHQHEYTKKFEALASCGVSAFGVQGSGFCLYGLGFGLGLSGSEVPDPGPKPKLPMASEPQTILPKTRNPKPQTLNPKPYKPYKPYKP